MRGFPLINLIAVLVGLVALLVPLLRLNSPSRTTAQPTTENATAAPVLPVAVALRFVKAPAKITVSVEGKVLELTGTGLDRQVRVDLPLRDKALEFDIQITWPAEEVNGMAEVSVAPDGLVEQRQNVWADGAEASEILRFEWKK